MKKHKILSAIAAALVFSATLSSCYDLDRFPVDQLSSSTFFKTQAQADQAMMGLYSTMQEDNVFGLEFGLDCLGGISMGYDNPSFQTIQKGTYDVTTAYISNKWKYLYEGVTRSNNVIRNIDGVDMSDDLKAQYKGEAKFMRALFYSTLLKFYGGVPIYDETFDVSTDFNNMLNPRETADKVREFIIADLDAAAAALPATRESGQAGRATSGAALSLKGKVLLFNKQYAEAATCFQTVVNSGKYQLYPKYDELFKQGGDESSEMIFAIQNMGGVGTDFGMPMCFYLGTRASFGSSWNNVMVATDFVDSYEWKDGRPFNWDEVVPGFTTSNTVKDATFRATMNTQKTQITSYPEAKETLLEMYANRDPRMAYSIILPYTNYGGWYKNAKHDCEYAIVKGGVNDGYHCIRVNGNYECYLWRKFVPEYNMDGGINNRADTPINFPIIRYADVLLMLAECQNELGKQDEAVELINQVRSRVDMPGLNSGPDFLKATTKEEVFNRIKHERAVELACEGHSFDDMRRWGLLETLNNRKEIAFTGSKTYYTRVVTARDYLWPIPADEIFKNPDLTQNPGWE